VAPTRESGVRTSSSSLWTQGRTAETPPVAVPYAGCRQAGRRAEPRHAPAAQSALPCRLPGAPPPGRASRFRPYGRAQVSPTSSLSSFFPLARVELRPNQSASSPVCTAAVCCSPRQDRASSSSCTCARSLLLPQHHRTIAGQPDGAVAAQARLRRAGPSRAGASTRRGRLRSNLRQ
jgi:hypothetical protein